MDEAYVIELHQLVRKPSILHIAEIGRLRWAALVGRMSYIETGEKNDPSVSTASELDRSDGRRFAGG